MLSFLGFSSSVKQDRPDSAQQTAMKKAKKIHRIDKVKDLIDDAFKVENDEETTHSS
jgi:hypothetical protein